jgi:hypothetical protein
VKAAVLDYAEANEYVSPQLREEAQMLPISIILEKLQTILSLKFLRCLPSRKIQDQTILQILRRSAN